VTVRCEHVRSGIRSQDHQARLASTRDNLATFVERQMTPDDALQPTAAPARRLLAVRASLRSSPAADGERYTASSQERERHV